MQGPVSDDLGETEVEIDDGREAHVHAAGAKLRRHEPTERAGGGEAGLGVLVVEMSEGTRRRQAHEGLAKALHAPAFLVHGDQQGRLADRVDLGHELLELRAIAEVAGEQDDAADERRLEAPALLGRQGRALDVDHERTQGHRVPR